MIDFCAVFLDLYFFSAFWGALTHKEKNASSHLKQCFVLF